MHQSESMNADDVAARAFSAVTNERRDAAGSTGWFAISNRIETLFPEALLDTPSLGTLRALLPLTSLFAIGSGAKHVSGGLPELFRALQELCDSASNCVTKYEFSVGQVDLMQLYLEALELQRPNEGALAQLLGRSQVRAEGSEPKLHSHLFDETGEEPLSAEEVGERNRLKKAIMTAGVKPLILQFRRWWAFYRRTKKSFSQDEHVEPTQQ